MDRHLAMARNLLGGIALAALALSGAPSRAADGDHDGRWRLEYSCGQNTANGAAPYRARVELSVEGGAVAARTASRNTRLNRDDTEQWSGRFTGAKTPPVTLPSVGAVSYTHLTLPTKRIV